MCIRVALGLAALVALASCGERNFDRSLTECGFIGNCCWDNLTCNSGLKCNTQTKLCEPAPDGSTPDLAISDLKTPDLIVTDQASTDQATVDLKTADQAAVDLTATADQAPSDLAGDT